MPAVPVRAPENNGQSVANVTFAIIVAPPAFR
jgi:hypothetical protein